MSFLYINNKKNICLWLLFWCFVGRLKVKTLLLAADRTAREYAERTGATFLAWPIPDPSETPGDREAKLAAYRETRDEIRKRIRSWDQA